MTARMYIWPRYALEVDGKRIELSEKMGAAAARLFWARGRYISRRNLLDSVYFDDPEGGPLWADGCIQQFLWRINQRLSGTNAHVENGYGRGHRLVLQ